MCYKQNRALALMYKALVAMFLGVTRLQIDACLCHAAQLAFNLFDAGQAGLKRSGQ